MLHPVGLYTTRGTTDPTVDLSDGFVKAFDGDVPDHYYRAQDQPTGSNPLDARIGTDGSSTAWPTYNATGISGQPSLDFDSSDRLAIDHLAAAQAADPNAPYSIVLPFRLTGVSSNGYVIAFGDSASANMTHGFYIDGSGNVGFFTRQSNGTIKDNVVGASAIPTTTDCILALTYRGTSGFEARTRIGSTDTVRLLAGSAEVLTAGNFPLTNCWLGRSPRTSTPATVPARMGGAVIRRAAWGDADLTAAMAHYDTLYPV